MKRDRAKEDDLRGWVEGAALDSSSLRVERIGDSDRYQIIREGEVIDELSMNEHGRLIAALMIIGEEHRSGVELGARKLAQIDGQLRGAIKGAEAKRLNPESKTRRITELARGVLARGEDPLNYVDAWVEQFGRDRTVIYKAIQKAKKAQ